MTIAFDNSYVKLPQRFYVNQAPVPVSAPKLISVNHALAEYLGIDADWLASQQGINTIAGNHIPEGAEPIAMVYAGHQFGHWNPRLGDGRAILLGEVIAKDGERYDIQLKGSGITPFSRNGDGRAPLGPIMREYIVSEAMAALAIPTSRTLAAVTSGEAVYRESRLDGAVLARVAKSHIRIGTLQYFVSISDTEALRLLVDHVVERHYPEVTENDNRVLELFRQIIFRIAQLTAHWQSVGFIHGVMNTDNMLVSGETIDYGPCAFMDTFDSAALFSSIDHQGRYAYRNQPPIAHWNLAALGQTLVPLLHDDDTVATELAQEALNLFRETYYTEYRKVFGKKLGIANPNEPDDSLIEDYLDLLEKNQCDFTLAFRRLSELTDDTESVKSLFDFPDSFCGWLDRWRQRSDKDNIPISIRQKNMLLANPAFIPRNHLVEEAIQQAYAGDYSLFHRLNQRLTDPFTYEDKDRDLATPPRPDQIVQQTFCGT